MIDDVETDRSTYAEPPLRFEAGTPPIAECIGLGAAVDLCNRLVWRIAGSRNGILRYGHQRLASVRA